MRNQYFDVLKAIAIIAVVLYHLGTCEYGYLGVDIFLVIAGYFTSQSIEKQIANGKGCLLFAINRLFRLLPLLLLAGVVCLGWGWMLMLPDDFENTAQSIVATNFFSNNILQAITTKNYWDVVNEYKPLMHTWYVGLIMQFYVLVSLLLFAVGRMVKDTDHRKNVNIALMAAIGIASLVVYLLEKNAASKFYFLPYRLYEFCAGGLMFYLFGKKQATTSKNVWATVGFLIAYLAIIALLFVDAEYVSRPVKLLATVGLTSAFCVLMPRVELVQGKVFSNQWIAAIGAASFSIFVWHQVVLALIRYSFTSNLTEVFPLLAFVGITAVLSVLSFKYVEKTKKTKLAWVLTGLLLILTTGASLYIYKNAGVVRDVPELEVVKANVHRGMWAEYCDRGYQYDKEFSDSDKPKWYVIGNSFGRDMVNIILESEMADIVEISYSYTTEYMDKDDRFSSADVVFLSNLGVDDEIIEDVRSRCFENTRFFVIGEKNFGENNGQVYRHRFESDYHQLTVEMEEGYAEKNDRLKTQYADCFIDMIALVQKPDGKVPVFSADGRFISQDCRHLTKAGARMYAKNIDWLRITE